MEAQSCLATSDGGDGENRPRSSLSPLSVRTSYGVSSGQRCDPTAAGLRQLLHYSTPRCGQTRCPAMVGSASEIPPSPISDMCQFMSQGEDLGRLTIRVVDEDHGRHRVSNRKPAELLDVQGAVRRLADDSIPHHEDSQRLDLTNESSEKLVPSGISSTNAQISTTSSDFLMMSMATSEYRRPDRESADERQRGLVSIKSEVSVPVLVSAEPSAITSSRSTDSFRRLPPAVAAEVGKRQLLRGRIGEKQVAEWHAQPSR